MTKTLVYFEQIFPQASETFVRAEIAELCRRGYDVKIAAFRVNRSLADDCIFRNRILEVPIQETYEQAIDELCRAIGSLNPAYIHAHFITEAGHYTKPVAERLGVPFGFTCHAADLWLLGNRLEPEGIKDLGRNPLCITAGVEGSYHRKYLTWCGVPEEKIVLMPNSVDVSLLPRPKQHPPKEIRKIVAIGRPVAKKGFIVAIDAMRLLHLKNHRMELEIVGGGGQETPLGKVIAEYAAHFPYVKASPMIPYRETLEQIKEADLLICPSIIAENGDRDGIPTVLTEAMLMRIPVISTDVGSITDLVVHKKTGFIARVGDAVSLAENILSANELAKDPEAFSKLLDNAEERAKANDIRGSINAYVANLEKHLGRF